MTSLKRFVALVLMVTLVFPLMTHSVFADDDANTSSDSMVSSSETTTTETTSTSDTTTNTDEEDTSESSSSSESVTTDETQLSVTATGESAPDEEISSTTPPVEETATSTPSSTLPEGLTDDAGILATSTQEVATSTPAILSDIATTTESSSGSTSETGTTTPVTDADTTITTGTASAGASVINVVGSNFVNSTGAVALGNYFDPVQGIDLRNATDSFSTGVLCILFTCVGDNVTLNLSGSSTLENILVLNATSGSNTITDATGSAAIVTGDAFTGLNLVNLANLNIVNSNYLLVALNAFQGINGDLVFPSLAHFFESLLGEVPSAITLESSAVVDNQIVLDGQTGNNTTNATSSVIATGNSLALSTLFNQLNNTQIGGANLAVLLRVSGEWNGQIFNPPAGLSVLHGDDGSILLLSSGGAGVAAEGATLSGTSTTAILNHVDLGAFTGDNGIFGADSASIQTGDARIGANILNLANQNIIGKNWLTAIINVFGDFNGNIAFGRPDLWIGERIEATTDVRTGSHIVFHFTISNKGDASASNVVFTAGLDSSHFAIDESLRTKTIATVLPGETVEITIPAEVIAPNNSAIPTSGSVAETETDNNMTDNTDSITLRTLSSSGGRGSSLVSRSLSSMELPLEVTRKTPLVFVNTGNRTVHQEVTIYNPNDATTTAAVDLHDLLRDPNGKVLQDEAWPLSPLPPHAEVTVTYDTVFGDDAPVGRYLLSTVLANDETRDIVFKDNGTIYVAGVAHVPSTRLQSVPIVETIATSTATTTESVVATSTPSLAASALLSQVPWVYALGFAGSASALAGLLWGAVAMRRRYLN